MIASVAEGLRLQFKLFRSDPALLLSVLGGPLQGLVLASVARGSSAPEVAASIIVACFLISMWLQALWTAGDLVNSDRWNLRLEQVLATPASYVGLLTGRIVGAVAIGSLSLVGAAVIVALFLPTAPLRFDGGLLVGAALLTGTATLGMGLIFAAGFVFTRASDVLQVSLTFPFFVLGGLAVPVASLPIWAQIPANVVYLNWSSQLLRAAFGSPLSSGIVAPAAWLAAISAAQLLVGGLLVRRVIDQARRTAALTRG